MGPSLRFKLACKSVATDSICNSASCSDSVLKSSCWKGIFSSSTSQLSCHCPLWYSKRIRSASWCVNKCCITPCIMLASIACGKLINIAWLKWCGSARFCSKNQWCTGVNGTDPVTRSCSASIRATLDVETASSAIVWCWKTCCALSFKLDCLARETIWILRIESPPNSKKLSWIPTPSIPNTSRQIFTRIFSVSLRGGAKGWSRSGRTLSGAGRLL